jgi:hypothetical protein
MAAVAAAEELQEQLLEWDEQLTRREEALVVREEKAGIFEKALVKVSVDLDAEWAKVEVLERSTLTRWKRTPVVPSTPSAVTRCWWRRRSSSTGESRTWTCAR